MGMYEYDPKKSRQKKWKSLTSRHLQNSKFKISRLSESKEKWEGSSYLIFWEWSTFFFFFFKFFNMLFILFHFISFYILYRVYIWTRSLFIWSWQDGKAYLASGAISASKPSSSSSVVASTKAQKDYIRELISEAKSLAEIDAIEKSLREGTFNFPVHLRLDGESSGAVAAGKDDAMMDVGQN